MDERLKTLGTVVWYVVSDRASALIQLAEQGLTCLSMPDFFHLMPDIVQSYSLALARQVQQAHKALTHAEAVLARHPGLPQPAPGGPEGNAQVTVRRAEVERWAEAQRTYRQHLATLSLTFHPFDIAPSLPQTSAQVAYRLQAGADAIEAFAERYHMPAPPGARNGCNRSTPTSHDYAAFGLFRAPHSVAMRVMGMGFEAK